MSSRTQRTKVRRGHTNPYTVLVPYFPARQTNCYPVVKPKKLDTKGRPVPWDVCYSAAALVSLTPETDNDDNDSETNEALLAVSDFANEWQVAWSNRPAMFFRNMKEVRSMCRLVFHVDDPATLGWVYLSIEKHNLQRTADADTVFISDTDDREAFMRVTRDPFLSS